MSWLRGGGEGGGYCSSSTICGVAQPVILLPVLSRDSTFRQMPMHAPVATVGLRAVPTRHGCATQASPRARP